MNETNLDGGVITAVLLQYNLTQLKAQCDLIHTVLQLAAFTIDF